MRILQTIPRYYPHVSDGGALAATHNLSLALRGRGCSMEIIASDPNPLGSSASVLIDGILVERLPLRGPFFLGFRGLVSMFCAIKRSDIVICQSVFNMFSFWVIVCCCISKKQFIISPRGMVEPALIRARRRWLKLAWLFVAYPFFSRASLIHFTSVKEKTGWESVFSWVKTSHRYVVIPNGVDPPDPIYYSGYFSEKLGVPDIQNCGVYFGRYSWKKNLFLLLDAIAAVDNLSFVFVGYEEDITRRALEDYADRLGISERVFVRDSIPADQKFDFLRVVRFNTLVSINENFGNSIAESAAVGTPVLVSNSIGAVEHISNSDLLFVCDSDQPEDLVRQLRNIMDFRKSASLQGGLPSWDEVAQIFCSSFSELNFK